MKIGYTVKPSARPVLWENFRAANVYILSILMVATQYAITKLIFPGEQFRANLIYYFHNWTALFFWISAIFSCRFVPGRRYEDLNRPFCICSLGLESFVH